MTAPAERRWDEVYPGGPLRLHDAGICVGPEQPERVVGRFGFTAAVRCLRGQYDDGVEHIVHAPLTDDAFEIVKGDWARACWAASEVVEHVRAGRDCYIYCREGLNRSCLVAALALRELKGITGAQAVAEVQSRREGSLYNWHFRSALEALGTPDGPLRDLPQPEVRR